MHLFSSVPLVVASSVLLHHAFAMPASSNTTPDRESSTQMRARSNSSTPVHQLESELASILGIPGKGFAALSFVASAITAAQPTATPKTLADEQAGLATTFDSETPQAILASAVDLILSGLSPGNVAAAVAALDWGTTSPINLNPLDPTLAVYPKSHLLDAPYSLTEAQLRQVIHIPSTFTYGQKQPVILIPGSGGRGGTNYANNYIKLLTGTFYADPVWINPPGFGFDDAQVEAEYVAYAINYIASITGRKVSVLGWSQGVLNAQWAFKYWPSTRANTVNNIALSPDYHGTTLANILCPILPCVDAVFQQEYTSNYIAALRANSGDSAYVPTTVVYSISDGIVVPQQDLDPWAALKDVRNVGVTNRQVQALCPGLPAGGFVTHEGVLYNALAFALAQDALINGGPGQVSRIDLTDVCASIATPGLTLPDVQLTEFAIPLAIYEFVVHQPRAYFEPLLKPYVSLPWY